MKHDSFSINEFKQLLSEYDGRKFVFNNEKFVILNEKLFYDDIPIPRRCMWYSMGTQFSKRIEAILNELPRNSN
jgi:hypothetical protein